MQWNMEYRIQFARYAIQFRGDPVLSNPFGFSSISSQRSSLNFFDLVRSLSFDLIRSPFKIVNKRSGHLIFRRFVRLVSSLK